MRSARLSFFVRENRRCLAGFFFFLGVDLGGGGGGGERGGRGQVDFRTLIKNLLLLQLGKWSKEEEKVFLNPLGIPSLHLRPELKFLCTEIREDGPHHRPQDSERRRRAISQVKIQEKVNGQRKYFSEKGDGPHSTQYRAFAKKAKCENICGFSPLL